MAEKERFHIVWDMDEGKPVDTCAEEADAMKLARKTAEDRLGSTIVVFEPKEAFRASAQTQKVYLRYPERAAEAFEGREPAPGPLRD